MTLFMLVMMVVFLMLWNLMELFVQYVMVIYNKAVCFEDPENYEIVQLLIVLMQLNQQ